MVDNILKEGDDLYLVTFEIVKSWTDKDAESKTIEQYYIAKNFPELLRGIANSLPLWLRTITIELVTSMVDRIPDE